MPGGLKRSALDSKLALMERIRQEKGIKAKPLPLNYS